MSASRYQFTIVRTPATPCRPCRSFDLEPRSEDRWMKFEQEQNFKWSNEANIERYGKLLKGRLTDVERRFVERRLAEEQDVCWKASSEAGKI